MATCLLPPPSKALGPLPWWSWLLPQGLGSLSSLPASPSLLSLRHLTPEWRINSEPSRQEQGAVDRVETRQYIMEKDWGISSFPLAPLHPSPCPEVSAWLHMGVSQKPPTLRRKGNLRSRPGGGGGSRSGPYLVLTWKMSLAHFRQRLCWQGRMTTGLVNISRQMGQISCFSRFSMAFPSGIRLDL